MSLLGLSLFLMAKQGIERQKKSIYIPMIVVSSGSTLVRWSWYFEHILEGEEQAGYLRDPPQGAT